MDKLKHARECDFMQTLNKWVGDFSWSGDATTGSYALLKLHGFMDLISHSKKVAEIAEILGEAYGLEPKLQSQCAALHNISHIIPTEEKLEVARLLGIPLLLEEEENPILSGQKLSVVMANKLFGLKNPQVLNAVGCHSTLKQSPSVFDMVFFISDKIVDLSDCNHELSIKIQDAMRVSLNKACLIYISAMLGDDKLLSPHPWLIAAYRCLHKRVKLENND